MPNETAMTDLSTRSRTRGIDRVTFALAAVSALFLTYTAAIPASATSINRWPLVLYVDILAIIPFPLLALWLLRHSNPRLGGTVAAIVAICSVVVSVVRAKQWLFSFDVGCLLLAGIVLALLISAVARHASHEVRVTHRYVQVTGVILSVPIITSLFLWLKEIAWVLSSRGTDHLLDHLAIYRNPHPFGHANYAGGYALLVLPWFIVLAAQSKARARMAWMFATAGCLAMLISSFSRGALLGLAVMSVAGWSLMFVSQRIKGRQAWSLAAAGFISVVTVAMVNPRARGYVTDPLSILVPNEGDVQRLAMLRGGWELAKERPWAGHGPGMTPFVFPEVRGTLTGGVETVYQLHNTYLQILVDQGLLGIVAMLAVLMIFTRGVHGWKNASDENPLRPLAWASACAVLGYFACALTDYQLNVPMILAVLALHIGIVASGVTPSQRTQKPAMFTNIIVAFLFGATLVIPSLRLAEWQARNDYWSAWWEVPEKNRQQVLERLFSAAERVPSIPFYRTMLGLQLVQEAKRMGATASAATLRDLSFQQLTESVRRDPAQEPAISALGWLSIADSPVRAEKHFQRALDLLPERETLHLGVAVCRLQQNDRGGAIHYLALECLVNPAFITSLLWQDEAMSACKEDAFNRLSEILERIHGEPTMPAWRQPHLAYHHAWLRWWRTGTLPPSSALQGVSPNQRAVFSWFRQLEQSPHAPPSAEVPEILRRLHNAFEDQQKSKNVLEDASYAISAPAVAGAENRLNRRPSSLMELLRMSMEQNIGLVQQDTYRLHYNIMARNLDGPGMLDLAPRHKDAFAAEFLEPLLPLKGALPGSILKALRSI